MTILQTTVDAIPTSEGRPTAEAPAAPAVSAKTWLAVIGATLGAFMAVLNIQIVNASLANIQGGIGAGIDDGGWISTSGRVRPSPRPGFDFQSSTWSSATRSSNT